MGICGSKKSNIFRPTGFKDGDEQKLEDENPSLLGSVMIGKNGKEVGKGESPDDAMRKKEPKGVPPVAPVDNVNRDKAKTKDKEMFNFEGEGMKVEKNDKREAKKAMGRKSISISEEKKGKEIIDKKEKEVEEEEIEAIDNPPEEQVMNAGDIKIAFSNSHNSEIEENRNFLEDLMNTRRSHFSKPNFSNVLMAKELASEIAAKSEKISVKKPRSRRRIEIEEFKIDPLGDVNSQYLNLYMMMKPDEHSHKETHPIFDGEYCVYEAEGYAKKLPKEDEDDDSD